MKKFSRVINKSIAKTSSRFYCADKLPGSKMELVDIKTDDEINHECEEVRIRMPFGHIAGKWWNNKTSTRPPWIALHGWQDNAGTFDRLIPLLPKDISVLALDLPGHGLSSRIPDGMAYHANDNLFFLNYLCKEYNWDKISIIGHSMGSVLGFVFASVFPERVDMLIGIDALKPHVYNPAKIPQFLEDRVEAFMLADQRNQEKSEPPAYTYEELVDRLSSGTYGSVTKETCSYLLKRAIKRSEKHPGKYFFTRDSRLKYNYGTNFSQDVSMELAKRLNMPYLFIKALNSPYYERKQYFDEVIDVLKKNDKFEFHTIDSTHHLHLTEPENVAPIINNFIAKHNKPISKL